MGLATKFSRHIVVNETGYRWKTVGPEEDRMEFVVQHESGSGSKLRAAVLSNTLWEQYRRVGKRLGTMEVFIPPFVVRQAVLRALRLGWIPGEGSGSFDLGLVDHFVDFSLLKRG